MAIARPFAAAIGSPHDIVRLDLSPLKKPHPHIPAHCMSIRPKPCLRNHAADMLVYRSIFFDILLACLPAYLTCLCNTLTPLSLGQLLLKQSTRNEHGTTPIAKTPSEFLLQSRSNRGAERVLQRFSHHDTHCIPEDCRFCPVHIIARSCHLGHIETC